MLAGTMKRLFAKRHIRDLDLSSVRAALIEKQGWSAEQTERAERNYKRFLFALAHKHPEHLLSPPCEDVDRFWHQHILDTRKYREDCDAVFGHYMDHTPGLSPAKRREADSRRIEVYDKYHIDDLSFDLPDGEDCSGFGSHLDTGHSHGGHSSHDCSGASDHGGHGCDPGDSGGDGGGGDGGGGCGGG